MLDKKNIDNAKNNQKDSKNIFKKIAKSKLFKNPDFVGILKGVTVGLILIAFFFAGYFTHYFSLNEELRSLDFLLNIYKEHYYKADEEGIIHAVADGLLDEYSGYYTAEEYRAYQKAGQGAKSGYVFAINDFVITSILGNSPAEKVGLEINGKIVGYKLTNGQDFIIPTTQSDFTDFLTQTEESVTLLVDYYGENKQFVIQKAEYLENYVYYSDATGNYRFSGNKNDMQFTKYEGNHLEIGAGWGYIRFTSFNGLADGTNGGAGQFIHALEKFKQNGNDKLIIDLRNNGGGYMSILCEIAQYLCDNNGKENFAVQGARYNDGHIEYFIAKKNYYDKFSFKKIIFLANGGSASASEALMGAVLDYDKNSGNNVVKVVVERYGESQPKQYRTYGKGIMQSMFSNTLTGEAVKLTTAEVIWPISHTSIHGVGLNPEIDSRIIANESQNAIEFAQTL